MGDTCGTHKEEETKTNTAVKDEQATTCQSDTAEQKSTCCGG